MRGCKCRIKISTLEKRARTDLTGTLRMKATPFLTAFAVPIGMTLKASHKTGQKKELGNFSLWSSYFFQKVGWHTNLSSFNHFLRKLIRL